MEVMNFSDFDNLYTLGNTSALSDVSTHVMRLPVYIKNQNF